MGESLASRVFAPAILRMALAVVFIYHGLPKVSAEAGYGTAWMKQPPPPAGGDDAMRKQADGLPPIIQGLVAWGEVLGGVAIALGLFTRVAALGIIVIMVGAIVSFHGQHGFGMQNQGFEYNFVLICVAAVLVLRGAGAFSLDGVIRSKMKGPSRY